jgi:hypothetical protein
LGICDRECRLCFALALCNGRDPILKERFEPTGQEGNHGEDVKGSYYYLDSTPTYSYIKALYKYPQRERLEEAKQCYTEALRPNPNLAMPYNNMSQAFQKGGNSTKRWPGFSTVWRSTQTWPACTATSPGETTNVLSARCSTALIHLA